MHSKKWHKIYQKEVLVELEEEKVQDAAPELQRLHRPPRDR